MSPQRYELESPLGEPIISGRGLMTARTNGFGTHAGTHDYLDALTIGTEAGLAIDESPETVAAI
jgi:hypothetical protein